MLRKLQRHVVTLHRYHWEKLVAAGDLSWHMDYLIQASEAIYHPVLGLLPEVGDYDPQSLVL